MSDDAPEVMPSDAPEALRPYPGQPNSWKEVQIASISKSTLTRWRILFVAATALIVGGAVGGGLATKLAECQSRSTGREPSHAPAAINGTCPVNNITAPPDPNNLSNYSAAPPETVSLLAPQCLYRNSSIYTTRFSENFKLNCGVDSYHGGPTLEDPSKTIEVRAGLIAYSLDDCIEACSAYNSFNARNGDPDLKCKSISWNHSLRDMLSVAHVNCWLKNGTLPAGLLNVYRNVSVAVMQEDTN